jgi:hypothetical protein
MRFHIGLRSIQALLLSTPEADTNCPIHLRIQSPQNAHYLDHHGAPRAIVRCTRPRVPGIEMRSHHHNFIRLLLTGYFAYDVHSIHVLIRNLGREIETD